MALNWDVGAVHDYDNLCFVHHKDGSKNLKGTTNSLIWLTLPCGYGTITENNWEKVFKRIRVYEMARGAMTSYPDGDRMITPDDVKAHIGLRTNASNWTDAEFNKNLIRVLNEEASHVLYNWKQLQLAKQEGVAG